MRVQVIPGPFSSRITETPEVEDAARLIEKTQRIWAGHRAAIGVSRDVDLGVRRNRGIA